MGKVFVIRCPLCGHAHRYKRNVPLGEFFTGSADQDVLLIEEVGGKHRGSFDEFDKGIMRRGRGSAKGRIEIKETFKLEELDQELKDKIREKSKEILEKIK